MSENNYNDKAFNNGGFSRRDFVKGSAALLGGALVSQIPFSASAGAYVAGSDTLKVAVIGCGGRGTGAAIQALSTKGNVKLVAMADAFRDRLDDSYTNIQKKFEGDKKRVDVPEKNKFVGFDGYKKAIALADVVILATPPGFRPIHFEEAVKAGKHVFMEKPVATDAPGVRRVLAAAEEAKKKNLKVVMGLQRRYQNAYLETIKRINDGMIGDVVAAQAYWHNAGVWVRPRQAGQTEMEYQMRNWYYFNWLCGDHINEQHIHNIDVVNWVKNGYPVSAQGMGGRQVRNGVDHGEIYDHHYVEYTYADGTILNSQCRHIPNTMNRVEETFAGSKGRVVLSGDGKGIITDLSGKVLYNHRGKDDPNPYQTEHDILFAAIRENKPYNNAEIAAKSTMTAIMGRMATYSGQVINWDEALNSEISIMPKTFAFDAETPTKPDANGRYPIPTPGVTKVV
ncbi:Gfo/Idh/MocA family protein [Adhaeribacter rhizoryzae]|uniref:Gfo/Idh/MocA family oxidoreductase n=1 Tax=Adhaeribacter rhizoryzae TaxID=2607907 RepID=A0A5M6DE42_9BACT|nr:Gfo/Idh/MocA family oxidoreductase [Adhaeribacter rhizoryzae]KAA5545778.1 Gfo/Idh/MocA family oxidoreductase [Adhaeribacter rhizoryzae]